MPSSVGGTREVPDEYAGAAHRELDRALHRARRANQAILLTACVALALVGTFVPGLFKFSFGFIAGAMLALIAFARDRSKRRAASGDAERRTAKVLRQLADAGWVVRHDGPSDNGNAGHLLIGPGGVYLVNTENWSGEISISDNGFPRTENADASDEWGQYSLPGRMQAAAAAKSQTLTALVGEAVWVEAVVVFWGRFDQMFVVTDKVTYVHGAALATWLQSRAETLPMPKRHALLAKFQ